jgi:methionine-rich copper-binding protein CopC
VDTDHWSPSHAALEATMRQAWTRLLVVASVALVAALAVPSTPALARDQLVKSNPQRNATLDAAPRQVAVTFSGQPQPEKSSITVVGPEGAKATDGEVKFHDTSMVIGFDATTKGEYTVAWEAVSADGERISGQYSFTLTSTRRPLGAPPRPAGGVSPSADAGSGGSEASRPVGAAPQATGAAAWLRDLPLTIWIVAASAVLVLLALVVLSVVGRRQLRPPPPGGGGPAV